MAVDDGRSSNIYHGGSAAEILFQLYQFAVVCIFKVQYISLIAAPELINGLIRIAHHAQLCPGIFLKQFNKILL